MRTWITLCLTLLTLTSLGQARRVENLIEKEKYENAYEVVLSGMEKDSTDAALPFVLSELYLTKTWTRANLDSAFYFAVLAIEKYDLLDEKNLDKHIRDGFGKTRLVELKEHIDHLAFERAKSGGKEEDYQQFLDRHADASDLDSAIYLRNEQAFMKASFENSLSSYKFFMDNYKDAKDWQEADARYQKILYNEITSSGKLKEYSFFAETYPNSPYYEDCVNKIYLIIAGENTTEVLINFVDNYPNTSAAQKAIGLLYHRHLEMEPASSFADKYPRLQISDSLKNVIAHQDQALIPVWNEDHIQFINLEQEVIIDSLTAIDPMLRNADYVSAQKGKDNLLIGQLGQKFYQGNWQKIEEMGCGFMAITGGSKTTVVHKNGSYFETGKNPQLIDPFISVTRNGKYGLVSVTGKDIAPAKYDSIWFQNGLIFMEQEKKVSPNLAKVFYPALDGNDYDLAPFYEEYEWLNDTLLWVAGNNKEGLFNNWMEPLVPFQKHRIDLAQKGWTITRKNTVQNPAFSEIAFSSFEENNTWQIGHSKDSLLVKYTYTVAFQPDSAFLLGPSSIEMRWGDSTFVYLTDTIRLYKPDKSTIRPLLDQRNEAALYELLEKKHKLIINRKGRELTLPEYSEIAPLNSSFFLLKKDKHYDLYNSSGEKLLEELDGAALINDSTISILKEQQFGLFRQMDSLYMSPQFEKKPSALTDTLWVISKNELYGVISSSSLEILPTIYEEIHYWTNGLMFLKKDLKWSIYDVKANNFPETGIIKYHSVEGGEDPSIIYQKGVGVGVFDSAQGIVLRPTYSSVLKKGTSSQSYYLADKHVEEASLHVLLYYASNGELLFQKVVSDTQYRALYEPLD